MTKPIVFLVSLISLTLSSSIVNAQNQDDTGLIYYTTDSSLLRFDKKTNQIETILNLSGKNKIIDFATNWKQGIVVLVHDSTHSILYQINGSDNKPDTLVRMFMSDGEPAKSIEEIDISPTGDFMVMKMEYWESHGIKLYDFRNNSVLDYVGNEIYLNDFIKWLPFNSILVTDAYGSDIDGPGDLIIYNYNLENNISKSWKIPMTIYDGFYDNGSDVSVICVPDNDTTKIIKGIRLNNNDLLELHDTIDNKQLKITSGNIYIEASIYNIRDNTFNLKINDLKTKSVISDEEYQIAYPQLEIFEFYSLELGSDTNIIVKFYVSNYINKNARTMLGSVLYFISLKGKLLYKTYDNIRTYRTGFNTEKYEHIYRQGKMIVNQFLNDKYIKSWEEKSFNSQIPDKISIE